MLPNAISKRERGPNIPFAECSSALALAAWQADQAIRDYSSERALRNRQKRARRLAKPDESVSNEFRNFFEWGGIYRAIFAHCLATESQNLRVAADKRVHHSAGVAHTAEQMYTAERVRTDTRDAQREVRRNAPSYIGPIRRGRTARIEAELCALDAARSETFSRRRVQKNSRRNQIAFKLVVKGHIAFANKKKFQLFLMFQQIRFCA